MKVKCEINDLNKISNNKILEYLNQYIHYSDNKLDMNMKREFTVYGIIFRENSPWFYVCDEERDEYPIPKPFEIFNIIDNRLSNYWQLIYQREDNNICTELVFDEWANDKMFYEKLIDGEKKEVEIFKKYRKLMDEEFK